MAGDFFYLAFICGACSATVLTAFRKWGLLERYSMYKDFVWRKLPPDICHFCFIFWLSAILVGLYSFFVTSNIFYIAVPFASASIGLAIYKACEK